MQNSRLKFARLHSLIRKTLKNSLLCYTFFLKRLIRFRKSYFAMLLEHITIQLDFLSRLSYNHDSCDTEGSIIQILYYTDFYRIIIIKYFFYILYAIKIAEISSFCPYITSNVWTIISIFLYLALLWWLQIWLRYLYKKLYENK